MKRFSLWFAVAVVLFSFQGGFSRPTKSQLDSLNQVLAPSVPVKDTINYDSVDVDPYEGEPGYGATNYWVAQRFVPTKGPFTLKSVYFQVNNSLINQSAPCYIRVVRNGQGAPDTLPASILIQDTILPPLPSVLWAHQFSDTTQQFATTDTFWILLGPVPGGAHPDSAALGEGWWMVHSTNPYSANSYILRTTDLEWVQFSYNWVLRAGGKYSDPPDVVINEIMFNPDISSADSARNHVWIELFNKGDIQTAQNWKLINGSNTPLQLPPFSLPSGKYLVVHLVDQDIEDLDFSDGRGDIYLNYPFQFFAKDKDACVLVTPDFQPSERTMLGWNLKNLRIGGTDTIPNTGSYTAPENPFLNRDVFKVARIQPRGAVGPILSIAPGISVGRDSSSSDISFTFVTPAGTDYKGVTFLGGPNSAGSTMGKKNFLAMEFDTVVADTIQQAGSWMVMLYIAGDYGDSLRSPDRWYFDVLNQIERVMPQSQPRNVNLAVLYDTRRGKVGGQSVSQAGATFRGTLKFDETGQVKNLELVSPSLNTGLPTTLSHFIAWAKDSSLQSGPGQSADHYVLALKGDGAGWQGLCGDEGDESRLEVGELRPALSAGLGGDTLDLIIFDSPLMGQIEIAAQVQGLAKYMVASPEMINVGDFDYARLVNKLAGQPSISSEDLAKFAVDSVLAGSLAGDNYSIWTAIRLGSLPILVRWVDTLAQKLRVAVTNPCVRGDSADNFQLRFRDQVLTRAEVDHYGIQAQGMADFIDLKNFARRAKVLSSCDSTHFIAANNIDNLLQAGGSLVISRFAGGTTNLHNNSLRPAGGLSIYFPSSRQRSMPIKEKAFFSYYHDSIDHAFDNPGVSIEDGEFDTLRVYAADAEICYPHTGTACSPILNDTLPGYNPHRPAPNSAFVDSTKWDEFLIRYYKPVADAGPPDYGSKNVGEVVSFDGSGSSDPDSDSLQYFWDPLDDSDNPSSCNSYSREDLDKNCLDAMDDDSILTGKNPTFLAGFPTDRTYAITLNVWDDNDITKPYSLRRFQTSKSTSSITVTAIRGFLVDEDNFSGLLPANFYEGRITRTGISVNIRTLLTCEDRKDPNDVNLVAPDENPIFWQTGRHNDCLFPSLSENRLKSRLDDVTIPRGVWVFTPKLAEDTAYQNSAGTLKELFRTYFGVNTSVMTPLTSTQILPVVDTAYDSIPLLQRLKTIFPIYLRTSPAPLIDSLESLGVVKPIVGTRYPLLKDEHDNVVAIASIKDFGGGVRRGRIITSFGLEHIRLDSLSDTLKMDSLVRAFREWMFNPSERTVAPLACEKGDLDSNGTLSPADVVRGLGCIFSGAPCDTCRADVAEACGTLSPADLVQLLQMIFNDELSECVALFRSETFKAIEQKPEKVIFEGPEIR